MKIVQPASCFGCFVLWLTLAACNIAEPPMSPATPTPAATIPTPAPASTSIPPVSATTSPIAPSPTTAQLVATLDAIIRSYTATPSPTRTPVAMSSFDCPREQIKHLVVDFFAAYNQHDLARLLNSFNFATEFSYFDNIGDQKHEFRSRLELEAYLQMRFAMNDHFDVLNVELPAQEMISFCTTNPTVTFMRSDAIRQYRGNAKLVVSSGQIHGVVTSSTLVAALFNGEP